MIKKIYIWVFVFILIIPFVFSESLPYVEISSDVVYTDLPYVEITIPEIVASASETYLPYNISILGGNYVSGNITSIQFYDDMDKVDSYNVSESAGLNGLIIQINFTGVTSIDRIILHAYYDDPSDHRIAIGLYSCTTGTYEEEYQYIEDTMDFVTIVRDVYDDSNHICSGNATIQLRQVDNGVTGHELKLDYAVLVKGQAVLLNIEHDSLSGRNNKTNHLWALDTAATRNVTGDLSLERRLLVYDNSSFMKYMAIGKQGRTIKPEIYLDINGTVRIWGNSKNADLVFRSASTVPYTNYITWRDWLGFDLWYLGKSTDAGDIFLRDAGTGRYSWNADTNTGNLSVNSNVYKDCRLSLVENFCMGNNSYSTKFYYNANDLSGYINGSMVIDNISTNQLSVGGKELTAFGGNRYTDYVTCTDTVNFGADWTNMSCLNITIPTDSQYRVSAECTTELFGTSATGYVRLTNNSYQIDRTIRRIDGDDGAVDRDHRYPFHIEYIGNFKAGDLINVQGYEVQGTYQIGDGLSECYLAIERFDMLGISKDYKYFYPSANYSSVDAQNYWHNATGWNITIPNSGKYKVVVDTSVTIDVTASGILQGMGKIRMFSQTNNIEVPYTTRIIEQYQPNAWSDLTTPVHIEYIGDFDADEVIHLQVKGRDSDGKGQVRLLKLYAGENISSYLMYEQFSADIDLVYDTLEVGGENIAMSSWQPFTMFISGTTTSPTKGTTVEDRARYRRVGENMEITYSYYQNDVGNAGSGQYMFNIPSGYKINTTIIGSGTSEYNGVCGTFMSRGGETLYSGYIKVANESGMFAVVSNDASAIQFVDSGHNPLSNNPQMYSFECSVPIVGWD